MIKQGNTLKADEGKYICHRSNPEKFFRGCSLFNNETEADFEELDATDERVVAFLEKRDAESAIREALNKENNKNT